MSVDELLRQRAEEHGVYLESELFFGEPWTRAASHQERLHRLDHLTTGFPWTYADGPAGFDAEHPFGKDRT